MIPTPLCHDDCCGYEPGQVPGDYWFPPDGVTCPNMNWDLELAGLTTKGGGGCAAGDCEGWNGLYAGMTLSDPQAFPFPGCLWELSPGGNGSCENGPSIVYFGAAYGNPRTFTGEGSFPDADSYWLYAEFGHGPGVGQYIAFYGDTPPPLSSIIGGVLDNFDPASEGPDCENSGSTMSATAS